MSIMKKIKLIVEAIRSNEEAQRRPDKALSMTGALVKSEGKYSGKQQWY